MGGNDPSNKLVSNLLGNLNSNILNWEQELTEKQREDLVMEYFFSCSNAGNTFPKITVSKFQEMQAKLDNYLPLSIPVSPKFFMLSGF